MINAQEKLLNSQKWKTLKYLIKQVIGDQLLNIYLQKISVCIFEKLVINYYLSSL